MNRILVLACGDVLRGDDGLAAHAVAGADPGLRDVAELRTVPALAVEDLLAVPADAPVVVVDAVVGVPPGRLVRIPLEELDRAELARPVLSGHRMAPGRTVELARALGWRPRGTFLGMGGASFALGAGRSPEVHDALPALRDAIAREVARLGATADP